MSKYMHEVSVIVTVYSQELDGSDITTAQVRSALDFTLYNASQKYLHEQILPTLHTEINVPATQDEWRKSPETCPHCMRYGTLEGGPISVENTVMHQKMVCTVCDGYFTAEYTANRYNSHED